FDDLKRTPAPKDKRDKKLQGNLAALRDDYAELKGKIRELRRQNQESRDTRRGN
ncbi:hypothetical protein BGX26_004062, partial [Mortierella sp. AD094]